MKETQRCQGVTKQGTRCRAFPTEGGLCFFHANPTKAAQLGRLGGRKNRRRAVEMDPLPAPDSAKAIREILERVISEAYTGQLPARTAAVLGPLLNSQLRAIESTEYEKRLEQIEQRLKELDRDEADTKVAGTYRAPQQ